jgi:hypothetical protein
MATLTQFDTLICPFQSTTSLNRNELRKTLQVMDMMDLEPLLVNINGRPANTRIRRRNSGTFRSIVRNRCFMLFLFGLFVFVGILVVYYNPDTYWFAQRPSYTIGEF